MSELPYRLFITTIEGTGRDAERSAALLLVRREFGPEAIIEHTEHGAPVVTGGDESAPHISISHTSRQCVLAVGSSPLGVDAESPRPQLARVKEKFLSTFEMTRLSPKELSDPTTLLPFWTAKEAVYKAAGTPGLGLSEIVVTGDTATARGRTFRLYREHSEGEMITIAIEANEAAL